MGTPMIKAVKGHTGRRAIGGCESQRTRVRHLCVLRGILNCCEQKLESSVKKIRMSLFLRPASQTKPKGDVRHSQGART